MADSLLTDIKRKKISDLIDKEDHAGIISILEKVKTAHAGTARTKDKRFVINEIVKHVRRKKSDHERKFLAAGISFCKRKEDTAKEIGISLIWRGYESDKKAVKKFLLKIADDKNWEVREYAGGAFANTVQNNPEFFEEVLSLASHHSENVRRAALFAALGLRNEKDLAKGFALMVILMFDKSKYVKKNLGPFILGSLYGNKFPKETLKKLKEWSKIRDENVNWNVIMAFNNSFGNNYPAEALKILKHYAGNTDLSTKRALRSTLNFLGKRHRDPVNDFEKRYGRNLL